MSGFLDNTQINYVFQKEGREGSARGGKNLQSIFYFPPPPPPSFWPCPAGWGFSALKFPPQPVPSVGSWVGGQSPVRCPWGQEGHGGQRICRRPCVRGVFARALVSPCWDGGTVLKCQGPAPVAGTFGFAGCGDATWLGSRCHCGMSSGLQLSPGTSSHRRGLGDAQETFCTHLQPEHLQCCCRMLPAPLGCFRTSLIPLAHPGSKMLQPSRPCGLKQGWVLGPGTAPLASAFLI